MSRSRLRDYLERIVGGGTPSRKVAAFWTGDIPWASVKDFREGALSLKGTQENISAQGLKASASNLIEAGVPIVCTRMAVGRAAIAQCAVAINQDLKALYPNSQLDAKYLVWWLEHARPKIEAQAIGSTVKGISSDTLLNWPVNFPLFREQQRIAEILDTIDTTIQRTEALIAKLKAAKAGLLHDLLTRGLDEKGSLQQYESQSALPPHWRVHPLIEVADIASGVTLGRKLHGSDTVELPYLRVANVQDGFLDLTEIKTVRIYKSEVPRYLLQVGDILVTTPRSSELVITHISTLYGSRRWNCIPRIRFNGPACISRRPSWATHGG
ncbi:Type-1 restriction enzyme EcoKI specificity protein [Calidithermus terrae]|uniref:Type-1 restriction enzyme EcoKI specificity protein n=1 Tax=Calidithermus terrae TaxID=1408545 RepID=A0A399F0F8_9DEIN|nr:restriction endonuclease subunit S [Calidithermus terrae]RIH90254.1 Type-1 restriction enzyme EcoKI specificity protein [Calidithermus terrae]